MKDKHHAALWAYELVMAGLAVGVIWLLTMPDRGWVRTANLSIWAVFATDYFVRLFLAGDRRQFVRRNIPDLVAILPLDFLRVARLARLARLFRVFRAMTVLWRAGRNLQGVLQTNGLGYMLAFSSIVVFLGGAAAWHAETNIDNMADGLWWSLVTATTVGYGDISPESLGGRLTATVLMLIGIGTLGMITGSIATYFLERGEDDTSDPSPNAQVAWLRDQLSAWDSLERAERRRLAAMLSALAEHDEADRSESSTRGS